MKFPRNSYQILSIFLNAHFGANRSILAAADAIPGDVDRTTIARGDGPRAAFIGGMPESFESGQSINQTMTSINQENGIVISINT